MEYYVEIIERADEGEDDDVTIKRMGPMSANKAEKVERGVDQRINPERFYSRVVAADAAKEE